MFARTPRLLLRPGFPEDAPALATAIADEAIVRNLATVPWPYRMRDAEAFLASPRDPVLPSLLVFERTAGLPIIGALPCALTSNGARTTWRLPAYSMAASTPHRPGASNWTGAV